MRKTIALVLVALISLSVACAWMDPPTDAEKENWKAALKNYTEKEFSGRGVAYNSDNDLSVSLYLSKRQTLTPDQWSTVFRDAFTLNPASWTEVYGYVLNQIEQSSYFEEYGYVWINNQSYWMTDIQYDSSGLFARLNYTEGVIHLNPFYWRFWTGEVDIGDIAYPIAVFKFGG